MVTYVTNQTRSDFRKNIYSNPIPTGNGISTTNQIGAPNASVMAPNDTTDVPITKDCHSLIGYLISLLPKKYDSDVRIIDNIKLSK